MSIARNESLAEFTGRVALVSGGGRGIGQVCCTLLAARGAKIALNHLRNDAAAAESQSRIRVAGGVCERFRVDAAHPEATAGAVQGIKRSLGPVALLVANAGTTQPRGHADLTYELWRETLRSNLDSAFVSIFAVKDGMLRRGFRRVVCLSLNGAFRPRPRQIDYCAAKADIIGMVPCLAETFAPAIRVNSVAPGLIDTDMLTQLDQAIRPGTHRRDAAEAVGKRDRNRRGRCLICCPNGQAL